MKETKGEIGCSSMREMLKDCLHEINEKIAKESRLGISSRTEERASRVAVLDKKAEV